MTKKTYLLLDDVRSPLDVFLYTFKFKYLFKKWVIVRNYKELKEWVFKNGLPYFISFDHDLHPSHYTPKEYWSDYEASKKWQEAQPKIECNGEDCAKFIKARMLYSNWENNGMVKPKFYVHSKNPVGRDKILKILNSF
jgi:hypothetical protein